MKINFGLERSSKSFTWLTEIGKQFAEDHDMLWSARTRVYLKSKPGIKVLIEWLKAQGYQITYWELPPLINNLGTEEHIAYGMDIKDNCPKFIEAKLKYD